MKTVNAPKASKKYERNYAEFAVFMIEQIVQRFTNQVFGELNKGTIEKFEDAQIGNYATILKTLTNRVRRKLMMQFNNARLEDFVRTTLSKADSLNSAVLYKSASELLGIDMKQLIANDIAKPKVNALILESLEWTKKLRDETLELFTTTTLREMALGHSLEDIMKVFKSNSAKRKDHAKFVARNQVANFNAMTSKLRHQKLGITKGIWVTSSDERVRKCHQVRNGKEFDLAEGLYSSCDQKTLFPGTDYQCRCTYKAILPDLTEQ